MMKKALLALDLSPAEAPLLGCMSELLKWGVRQLVVVHVVRIGYGQGPGYRQLEDTTTWLEQQMAPLRSAGLEVAVQVRQAGVPADEILIAASEVSADLVVVGSRSHNLAHRLFLGSVARDLIQKTRLPLLLQWIEADPQQAETHCHMVCSDTLRRVVLATDLSRHASAAEAMAIALSGQAQQMDCLHVISSQAIAETPALPIMSRAALDALLGRMQQKGGQGQAMVVETQDAPADAIARTAEAHNHSMIVVGKHGRHWVKSVLIGSTASRLCEMAGRPVLLVPLADDQ